MLFNFLSGSVDLAISCLRLSILFVCAFAVETAQNSKISTILEKENFPSGRGRNE